MMRFIRWTLLILLSLVLLLVGALAAVLFTEQGTRFVLQQADKYVPGLTLGESRGPLIGLFELDLVEFEHPVFPLRLTDLELGIDNSCWTQKRICLDHLRVSSVDFKLLPSDAPVEPEPEPTEDTGPLSLPFVIEIGEIDLGSGDIGIFDQVYQWQKALLEGAEISTNENGLVLLLEPLTLEDWFISIPPGASGDEEAASEETETAEAETEAPSDEAEAASLPTVVIPLEIDIGQLTLSRGEIEQLPFALPEPIKVEVLALKGHILDSQIKVAELTGRSNYLDLDATAAIELAGAYPLEAELTSTIYQFGLDGQKLALNAEGDLERLNIDADLTGAQDAKLVGLIQPLVPDFPFDVKLDSDHLQWPLQGEADYQLNDTRITAAGSLASYQVEAASSLSGNQLPDTEFELKMTGDLTQAKIDTLKLVGLDGEVTGQVDARWSPDILANASLSFRDIRPENLPQLKPAEPEGKPLVYGRLNGDIEAQASVKGDQWRVELPVLDIDGTLLDLPLKLGGAFEMEGKGTDFSMQAQALQLEHGPNSLIANGELTKEWNMQVRIDAPSLEQSVPGLFGRIQGQVDLAGKAAEPNLKLDLETRGIRYEDQAELELLQINGELTPLPGLQAELTVRAKGGRFATAYLDELSLDFGGDEASHQLELGLTGHAIIPAAEGVKGAKDKKLNFGADLAANGSLDREQGWQGELAAVSLKSPFGTWVLDRATAIGFEFETGLLSVASHCWNEGKTSLCLQEDLALSGDSDIKLQLSQLDLARFKAALPDGTRLSGIATLDVLVNMIPEQLPVLDAKLKLDEGGVRQVVGDSVLNVTWREIGLTAALKDQQLNSTWLIDLGAQGRLDGKVRVTDLQGDPMVNGSSKIDALTLDFLRPLLVDIATVTGEINSDIEINGPATLPDLQGNFTLGKLRVTLDQAPIVVEQGEVALNLRGKQAELDGRIQTAEGVLSLNGDISWPNLQDWQVALNILGEQLQIDVPPLISLEVSSDLNLAMNKEKTALTGTVTIPRGAITADELPVSAVGLSDDLVLLDANLEPVEEEEATPLTIESDIRVTIGNDVSLSAFGLEAMLAGDIAVQQAGTAPRLSGEINILDGTYRSFGQELVIDKGQIIFNGPADQPFLSVEAIRDPDKIEDNVTAGIRVTGPADEPSIEIFSTPSMPQPNALSYLLRGRDLDSDSGGNNAMSMALLSLGLARSGKLVGEVGSAFGISGLTVDTGGTGDSTSVNVSGYILPKLKVTYGVGVFNSVGALTVRYELLENLYAVAESSIHSALDLLYAFELE